MIAGYSGVRRHEAHDKPWMPMGPRQPDGIQTGPQKQRQLTDVGLQWRVLNAPVIVHLRVSSGAVSVSTA